MPNYAPGFPIDDTENGDSIFNEAEKLKSEFVKAYDCINEVVNVIIPNLLTNAINSIETIPKGLIAIWSGSADNVPANWHLCDGTSNTPDLRDKFIIGAGNKYKVGETGGEPTHTLTIPEMPKHNHTDDPVFNKFSFRSTDAGMSSPSGWDSSQNWEIGGSGFTDELWERARIKDSGGSQPHNNMPPFYALCYIMKV